MNSQKWFLPLYSQVHLNQSYMRKTENCWRVNIISPLLLFPLISAIQMNNYEHNSKQTKQLKPSLEFTESQTTPLKVTDKVIVQTHPGNI